MDLEPLRIDRSGAKRRRRRAPVWFPRLVVGGGALFVAVVLWVFWRPLSTTIDSVRLTEVTALRVEKSHPAAVGAVRGMAANGYVVAARRAALSADTPGRIVELNVTEGSVVKKGDVVARLYSEEYAAAHRLAQADLVAAQATLTRARAGLEAARAGVKRQEATAEAAKEAARSAAAEQELAEQELARAERLAATGVTSARDLDQARANQRREAAGHRRALSLERAADEFVADARSSVAVAAAEVEVAQAQVAVRRAACEQAAATLSKTAVVAPFDGVVVLKDAEVGEVVSPNVQGGTNARGSVVTMVDFDSLEVQADVPETSLGGVRIQGPVQIFLDAYPQRAYAGTVARIWPTANRQKATVEVRVRFAERDDRLRPEMGVRVVFLPEGAEAAQIEEEERRLLVPEEALVRLDGREGVFVLERDRVTFRALDLGERRSGRVEVLGGLVEGERIVAAPPLTLETDSRVLIRER